MTTPYGDMIDTYSMIPNRMARFCTEYLKIVPMQKYLNSIGLVEYKTAMGIRYDKQNRVRKHLDKLLPLNDYKITKRMVLDWWKNQDFDLELEEQDGNCDLCHLKSERKIKTILRNNPKTVNWWKNYEEKYGSSFYRKPISELIKLSKEKFHTFKQSDILSQEILFAEDIDISCFCGD